MPQRTPGTWPGAKCRTDDCTQPARFVAIAVVPRLAAHLPTNSYMMCNDCCDRIDRLAGFSGPVPPLADLYFALVNRYNIVPMLWLDTTSRDREIESHDSLVSVDTSLGGAINIDFDPHLGHNGFQLWYRTWGPDHGCTSETELGSANLAYVAAAMVSAIRDEHAKITKSEADAEQKAERDQYASRSAQYNAGAGIHGKDNPLTDAEKVDIVTQVRESGVTYRQIANQYGISVPRVSQIVKKANADG